MTPERFAYWLQGFAELTKQPPTQEQWDSIRAHLETVFVKVTPQVGQAAPSPQEVGMSIRDAIDELMKRQPPSHTRIIC